MGWGKRTIRGITINTDKSDEELQAAAGRWAEGKDHDDLDFQDLWDQHSDEVKNSFIKGAEKHYPAETAKRPDSETRAEFQVRMKKAEEMRQELIQEKARSLFAGKLLPGREERFFSTAVASMTLTDEEKERIEHNSPEKVEARKMAALEGRERQRRQEGM